MGEKKKDVSFSGNDEIGAVLRVYPFLNEILTDLDRTRYVINCVFVERAVNIVDYGTPCANGFNVTGWIYTIKEEKIYKKTAWDEIRQQREELNLPEWAKNSAQTFLDGSENMCVFVQEHEKRHISIHIFCCFDGHTFSDFAEIKAWINEPAVRQRLREITE